MPVISILNPKGGSGKTTLSTNLARSFHNRGHKVLLVDSDPQGSASDWHAARDDNPIAFIAYGKPENLKALPGIAEHYDYVFIDGALPVCGAGGRAEGERKASIECGVKIVALEKP